MLALAILATLIYGVIACVIAFLVRLDNQSAGQWNAGPPAAVVGALWPLYAILILLVLLYDAFTKPHPKGRA